MHLSSLIGHSAEALQHIMSEDKPADSIIDSFFRSRKYLGSHDRRFIAETTYGTLRHLRRCDALFRLYAEELNIKVSRQHGYILLVAMYLIDIQKRNDIAVQDLFDAMKERTTNLAEFISRAHSGRLPEVSNQVEQLGLTYSFTNWMVEKIQERFKEEAKIVLNTLNTQAPPTIRVNTLKITREECKATLQNEGVNTEPTIFSPVGLKLTKRINTFQLQSFRDGLFEVQDEGSQLLPLVADPRPTDKVLDACAGAGGKTLALASLMKNRGEILATDINGFRLKELRRRANRAGAFNIKIKEVTSLADLNEAYSDAFDVVLIDAPCSGLGTLRRNPGMKWSVDATTIEELTHKQSEILELIATLVKVGGKIVYATCTFIRDENEGIVEKFLAGHPNFVAENVQLPQLGNLNRSLPYLLIEPHKTDMDGFFCALLRRKS
jgi:16S rRNA (cytosine967-C5)-methyltransferase